MRVCFVVATVCVWAASAVACVGDSPNGTTDAGQDGSDGSSNDVALDTTNASLQPPRQVAPLSTATVTSQKPTFHWQLATGTDGAVVDICKDRACTNVITTLQATGTSAAPSSALPAGVLFWRLRGRSGAFIGVTPSPTWQLVVGAHTAALDASWGTTPDVNGDGFADVLVGARNSQNAFVYLGAASGVAATAATTLTEPGAVLFGASVASAGDVNGDGFADVIVGDPSASGISGDGGTTTNVGKAYVYYGGPSGLAVTPAATLLGTDGQDGSFGGSVSSAGDVNGDGYADVIVGACNGAACAGKAYVFLGSAQGLASTPSATLTGSGADFFGAAVASVGDVNGDGYGDVAVAAELASNHNGEVDIFMGSATGLSTTALTKLMGADAGGELGTSVACAGDVNGDGYADVVAGAQLASSNAGKAYVYLGSATGLGTAGSPVLTGPDGGNFGSSVATAGDVNGDGYADVVIGARLVSSNAGRAYLYLGNVNGLSNAPIPIQAPDASGQFGSCVSAAGDVDGDGFGDVVIGAPYDSTGRAYVFLGSANGPKSTPAVLSATGASSFGYSLASNECSRELRVITLAARGSAIAHEFGTSTATIM